MINYYFNYRMAAKELIKGLQDQSNEESREQIIKLSSTYGNNKFKVDINMYHKTSIG